MPNSDDLTATAQREEVSKPQSIKRSIAAALVALLAVPALIALGVAVWDDRKYYIVSLLIILISMIPFAMRFERRKPQARELVVLAVMVAIGVAGRAAFYMVPQFKPVAAIVIITGIAFGGEAGYVVGAMTGFLSNFIFGQGPWTPWQMAAFGIVGLLAGLLFHRKDGRVPKLLPLCIFGFFAAFAVYGVIVDCSTLFTNYNVITWKTFLAILSSGVVFNLIHGAGTFVFLLLLANPMLKKLNRIRVKYGLLD